MRFGSFHDNSPRLPTLAVILLAALYLIAGTTGHDPWKTEDAIHIGIAHGFATAGHWLFPHVAGEPWPHTAPLYHWIAALLGQGLDGLLPFHDAARLASALFGALFLFALARAARALHGETAGKLAPLLAMGTLGLLLPLHEAQPAAAGLACAALAWWGAGLCLNEERGTRRRGALLAGLAIGLSFPAHGLAGLVMTAAVLPAPTFRRDWTALALMALVALPLALAWPLLLVDTSPALWDAWWRNELAEAALARTLPTPTHAEQLAWASWPLLPLALWSAWLLRRQSERLVLPLLGVLFGLAWYLSGSYRLPSLLPALTPLALLAAAGAGRLRRGAANAFDWFALTTFSFFAALVWLGASAQALDWPARIAANFEKLAPGHAPAYSLAVLAWAAALTLGWLASWRLPRANWRASLHWAAGTTLIWSLTATLWMSWIDHGRSYRPVALALRAVLPANANCIERHGIGPAQRASLDYFAGIRTLPAGRGARQCDWRLTVADPGRVTPDGREEIWRGGRPSDRKERWYLDKRID